MASRRGLPILVGAPASYAERLSTFNQIARNAGSKNRTLHQAMRTNGLESLLEGFMPPDNTEFPTQAERNTILNRLRQSNPNFASTAGPTPEEVQGYSVTDNIGSIEQARQESAPQRRADYEQSMLRSPSATEEQREYIRGELGQAIQQEHAASGVQVGSPQSSHPADISRFLLDRMGRGRGSDSDSRSGRPGRGDLRRKYMMHVNRFLEKQC